MDSPPSENEMINFTSLLNGRDKVLPQFLHVPCTFISFDCGRLRGCMFSGFYRKSALCCVRDEFISSNLCSANCNSFVIAPGRAFRKCTIALNNMRICVDENWVIAWNSFDSILRRRLKIASKKLTEMESEMQINSIQLTQFAFMRQHIVSSHFFFYIFTLAFDSSPQSKNRLNRILRNGRRKRTKKHRKRPTTTRSNTLVAYCLCLCVFVRLAISISCT